MEEKKATASRWRTWDLKGSEERERETRRKESGRVVRAKRERKSRLFLRKILREMRRVERGGEQVGGWERRSSLSDIFLFSRLSPRWLGRWAFELLMEGFTKMPSEVTHGQPSEVFLAKNVL